MYKKYLSTQIISATKLALFVFIIFNSNCNPSPKNTQNSTFEYVRTLQLAQSQNKLIIEYPEINKKLEITSNEIPLQNCMIVTTPSIAYFDILGLNNQIKAVCNPQFIYNLDIKNMIEDGQIIDVGNESIWNIEKILTSQIKYIFTSYNPTFESTYQLLENKGIKIIFIEEYKESEPLARAELLKLFGILFGKEKYANEQFRIIKNNYLQLATRAKKQIKKPRVFAKIMYSDVWYMPEGNSFVANLYRDAGGDYIWKNSSGHTSLQLSYEDVFTKAKNADYWLEVSDIRSKKQLLTFNEYYQYFEAYRNNQLYAISQRINSNLANDYYEMGVVRVDWVLEDIVSIFHPNILPNHSLRYYKKLE